MITTFDELVEKLTDEVKRLEETYSEVPDPDNPGETLLVHKGFEDLVNDNE